MSGGPGQRRLILCMSMSLDGFVARRDGVIDWLGDSRPHDGSRQRAVLELLGQTGMLVLGRRVYEDMVQAWPTSQSAVGDLMNTLPKVVFSSTLAEVSWSNGLALLHGLPEPLRLESVSSTAYADGPVTHTYVSH